MQEDSLQGLTQDIAALSHTLVSKALSLPVDVIADNTLGSIRCAEVAEDNGIYQSDSSRVTRTEDPDPATQPVAWIRKEWIRRIASDSAVPA